VSFQPAPMFGENSYASVARRLGALAIDWFASLGIAVLVFREFAFGTPQSMLATTSIFFVEIVFFTYVLGSSFGQKLLGMRVVNNLTGGRLSLWRVPLRTLLIILVIPALVMDPDGRGLHDRIVGSRVIRVFK
jgi:uncharacterized RDD family membrane protein YckC